MAPPREASTFPVAGLVGREPELRALRELLARPPPLGIVLEGEAGIGKTVLWQAGIAEAAGRGLRVLVARPVEAETGLSYAALGDLLGPLVDEFGDALPEPQRHALGVALLRATSGAGSLDRRAVGAATHTALRAAADRAPLLLAIDDLQWLDAASATAIVFALRRLADEPVVLLATRRAGSGAEAPNVGFAEERLERITVGPLPPDALHRMLQDRLSEPVPRPAVARLFALSGGNPYYALELARAGFRLAGSPGLSAELPIPEGVFAVLQDRLLALPPATREALGTVAAMGRPTIAASASALDPGVLDAAFAAEVICEEGATIRFEHPLLAEAAYRLLPPSRRRGVHERLAGLATDAEERARHLAAGSARSDARVAAEIEKGAEVAASRGAPAAAAELLEASARVEPEPDAAARRRIAAARHHMAAGDGRRATALARALVDELPPGPLRARALVVLSEGEGQFTEFLERARQAVVEAGTDREALLEALHVEGVVLLIGERRQEAHEVFLRAKELCRPDDPRPLRLRAMADYSDLAYWRGEPGAMDLQREAAELEGDDLIPNAAWGPGTVLGRSLMFADDLHAARALLERRHRRALEMGDDESRVALSLHLAEVEMRAGRFDDALAYVEEGLAIQEASYAEQAQGSLSYGRALVAAFKGDVALARERAERGLARCESQGDGIFAAANQTALGFLELSLGDNAAAVEWLWPACERLLTGRAGDPGLRPNVCIPDAIEALIGLGRLEEAEEVLRAWEQAGQRFDRPRIRATAARCRALLAAARGDLDGALVHAEAALEHHRGLPIPFERARTLIVVGTLNRRAKHKAVAREALKEALESLEAMGARLWAERARAELARIGGRTRSGGLTPTEERVADLVAEGRSNKEVAGALFVSVRSVEANLTRIYAKLGVRSRTELASRRRPGP